ncbi:tubby C-terminal domain-like protein [Neobacillus drentensis]|uniref:tubby C-terminal domain-like protein n=1 Tax=Neobacillus drentensis TaxID=220684 RepID=UPI003000B841
MSIYTYTVPEYVPFRMTLPIYNEQNEVVFLLKKNRHRLLTQIAHWNFRGGMPFCYQVQTQDQIPIYKIECLFTGIRYKLLNGKTGEKLPIHQQRVQLLEKMQTVSIKGAVYSLERDPTDTGILRKGTETIATVRNLDHINTSLTNRIRIEASDDQTAALAAVMYHTFIFFGA